MKSLTREEVEHLSNLPRGIDETSKELAQALIEAWELFVMLRYNGDLNCATLADPCACHRCRARNFLPQDMKG